MKTNKKSARVKEYFYRMILQSLAFFIFLAIWQIMVFIDNVKKTSNPLALVFLLGAIVFWVLSYFEIRTLTPNDERFLGYKAYILFFYKLVLFPLSIISAILALIISENVLILIMFLSIWIFVYYLMLIIFIKKYFVLFSNEKAILYISYLTVVKKWYHEGEMEA